MKNRSCKRFATKLRGCKCSLSLNYHETTSIL
jgi:hypothetical protein